MTRILAHALIVLGLIASPVVAQTVDYLASLPPALRAAVLTGNESSIISAINTLSAGNAQSKANLAQSVAGAGEQLSATNPQAAVAAASAAVKSVSTAATQVAAPQQVLAILASAARIAVSPTIQAVAPTQVAQLATNAVTVATATNNPTAIATAANAAVQVAQSFGTFSGGITLSGEISVTTAAGRITTFSGAITGAGGIDKVGAGTVVLSGTNTFSGGTTVSAGTLSAAADAAFGDSSGGITLGGGTLELTSGFTLGSGRTLTAAEDTASTLTIGSGLTVTFDGPVAGSGDLEKAGAGQLTLGNASTGYTGSFTISAGTVELTAANAFANATITQTGGTLLLNPAGGGTDVDVPDFGGVGGEVSVALGKNANFGSETARDYGGRIRGQGGLKKSGNGRLTLDQDNDFAGATEVTAGILEIAAGGALSETSAVSIATGGRLLLNGRVGRSGNAANVSVGSGGILAGAGQVFGTVGGAGGVGPGNSPGILEAIATDPSGGLDYEFEFTNLSPDYSNAGASVNDLFRLTDTSSPFSGSQLGAGNVIDLYFNDGSFAQGRTYTGGFFLDATAGDFVSFLDAIDSATANVFVADAGGGVSYGGNSYLSLADYNTANGFGLSVSLGVATIPTANFSGGTVTNGQAMQAVVVPEPDAFLLSGLGLALIVLALGRLRLLSPGFEESPFDE